MKKTTLLLLLALLLIYATVGFFTHQNIQHKKQATDYALRKQGERDIAQLIRLGSNQLKQIETQLSAITQFLDTRPDGLQQLIRETTSIKHIFVIDMPTRQLNYPNASRSETLSADEIDFVRFIRPFVNDPSLLMHSPNNNDTATTDFGWFVGQHQQQTTLIYWQKQAEQLIGYELSYAVFRADIIATIDGLNLPGAYAINDNGKPLLTSPQQLNDSIQIPMIKQHFPYPLQQWQATYQPFISNPTENLWLSPLLSAAAFLSALTLLVGYTYREMQRNLRLAQQQVQFVGQVSHELKTPLTNIHFYTEMLKEAEQDNPQTQQYLQVIEQESSRLSRLIQNVLSFGKPVNVRSEAINVTDLLTRLQNTFSPALSAKNITLTQRIGNDINQNTMINSDADKLIQILSNFLNNAEKYAAEGGKVDIEAELSKQTLHLSIRDYGKGLSKSEIKQIFNPFYRIHNHITEGVSGTGIGLTIAKQLATALGASIIITNSSPGLRCCLSIPYSPMVLTQSSNSQELS